MRANACFCCAVGGGVDVGIYCTALCCSVFFSV
jgi:hypothetical protein